MNEQDIIRKLEWMTDYKENNSLFLKSVKEKLDAWKKTSSLKYYEITSDYANMMLIIETLNKGIVDALRSLKKEPARLEIEELEEDGS